MDVAKPNITKKIFIILTFISNYIYLIILSYNNIKYILTNYNKVIKVV